MAEPNMRLMIECGTELWRYLLLSRNSIHKYETVMDKVREWHPEKFNEQTLTCLSYMFDCKHKVLITSESELLTAFAHQSAHNYVELRVETLPVSSAKNTPAPKSYWEQFFCVAPTSVTSVFSTLVSAKSNSKQQDSAK